MTPERWSDVERIYHAALSHDPAERAAFLADACAGDEALRREVESLLRSEPKAVGFMSTPAVDSATLIGATAFVGRQLGPYVIQSPLGAGGMGEVYRARDSKLHRDVAIKILPPIFTSDPDRLARFEREARLLAALNHPHIGAIYGLEDVDGVPALVLELVEGPTLADRISRGAMAPADVLPIAKQIAQALEAAHEQGIIHRDLKPANIKVRLDGVVKVLDFGLAKALDPVSSSSPETMDSRMAARPTATTGTGVIVGTAAYMSPEQARGQVVDKRTDIWAFGCVLFEMLTGVGAFNADTVSDTIVTILTGEPAWEKLPHATPPGVRVLLQRCLEKDANRRLRDIGEARIEIERWAGVGTVAARAASTAPQGRARFRVVGFVVLTALAIAGAWRFYSATPTTPVTSPSEYTQLTDFTDSAVAPALSPDGRMVTFIRGGEFFYSSGQIYIKLLPNGESMQLTNDADAKYGPVFTPDGSRIAYTGVRVSASSEEWDTWTIPVLGGQPTRLLPNASGLTWISERLVLFSEIMAGTAEHMGIMTATDGRAEEREIYFPPHELAMAHYSYVSPDRKSVLVVEMNQSHTFNQPCRLLPFDGRTAGRQVGPPGTCTSAAWSPDGKWMYFGSRVGGSAHLWRQRFPDGAPEQITFGPTEEEGVALAPDGRSLVTSVGNRRSVIWLHDAAGERPISSEGYALSPRLSRDGTRVFYLFGRDLVASYLGWLPAAAELRSVDLASGKTDSVLPGVSVTDYDLSRDEKEVAFTTTVSSGESQIWLASLDRRTPPRPIARGGDSVSFAGQDLVFRSLEGTKNFLVRIKKDGTGRERMTSSPILDKFGVSPEGEWVSAESTVVGDAAQYGIIAVPMHGGAPRKLCVDCRAVWSSDGRFLYAAFRGSGSTLAIPVPAGKSLPDLPASGITFAAARALPGVRAIEHVPISPGPDPSTYVFVKTENHRNLFRIPLH